MKEYDQVLIASVTKNHLITPTLTLPNTFKSQLISIETPYNYPIFFDNKKPILFTDTKIFNAYVTKKNDENYILSNKKIVKIDKYFC